MIFPSALPILGFHCHHTIISKVNKSIYQRPEFHHPFPKHKIALNFPSTVKSEEHYSTNKVSGSFKYSYDSTYYYSVFLLASVNIVSDSFNSFNDFAFDKQPCFISMQLFPANKIHKFTCCWMLVRICLKWAKKNSFQVWETAKLSHHMTDTLCRYSLPRI